MKLQKITIKNFRGLKGENNTIDFSNSNIIFLIGQNNVGKSTYLRAYEFFVNPSQSAVKEDFYNYDISNPIIIEGWFLKEKDDDDDEDLQKDGKKIDPKWADKWVGSDGFIKIRKTWNDIGKFKKETFSPSENKWVDNGFGGMDSLFTKYSPTPIAINAMEDEASLDGKVNKLIQDSFIKKVREQHKDICDEIIAKIKELQEQITDSDDVKKLDENLNKHFQETFSDLKLKIQADKEENIDIESAFKKNHTISVTKQNGDRAESFLQNGHGIIRQALFNFIAFLKDNTEGNKKEFLILFEEPELFLHPRVTFKLRESLYHLAENSPYQILCATHSPMMIDVSKQHSSLIRAVKFDDEETKTYQVGDDIFAKDEERKQRVQMINRFNPHICEAFYADKVILVEGDTETIVYRDLIKRFYPNEEVFVLNTGSKNNIPFFQEILTKFRIKHFVIHDMDNEINENGNANSAWTLNKKIWELVLEANKIEGGLARRYVHNANFENAHKYNLLSGKDKPLQAYKFAQLIKREDPMPDCLKWLDDIMGEQKILHDDNYIEQNKKTLEQIKNDEKSYKDL
jgi:predicted ATP-dependent endonuclease of OLD family